MLLKKLCYSIVLSLCLFFFISSAASVFAVEAEWSDSLIDAYGLDYPAALTDGDYNSFTSAWDEGTVTVSRSDEIHGLYLVFDRIPTEWSLTDPYSGQSIIFGTNGFLHEYVDIAALFGSQVQSLTLIFPKGTVLADIYAFSAGDLPDWVQIWQPPCEEADLLLFTSHSDDEQLFFAGILPLYAGEYGYNVQVAYMVQHFEVWGELNHQRPHEQLNGLWAVGVTNYPVMSDFPDLYSESLSGAIETFGYAGVTESDFSAYMTECIRRFKPLVVVSHDPNGEYGHGTHIFCTKTLMDVLAYSDDASVHPESAERYGTWLPEKVYLHLYPENQICLDLDTPLSSFDGKTAFEMTQYGFSFHKSQHWTWFNGWINGVTMASQITAYSPCLYGLYHTTVGVDTIGGDLFENIVPYTVRNAAKETEPAVETEAPETVLPETVSDETSVPSPVESDPEGEDETFPVPSDPNVSSDDTDNSAVTTAVIVFFAAVLSGIILLYVIFLAKINPNRKMRRRSKNSPR